MSYHPAPGHAGLIVLTFCDRANNQFVDLAGFSFPTAADLEQGWRSVPTGPTDSSFLADLHTLDGMEDNRDVSAEWIEARVGRPISALIAEGRAALAAQR